MVCYGFRTRISSFVAKPEELHSLPSLGVYSISLQYKEEPLADQYIKGSRGAAAADDLQADHELK